MQATDTTKNGELTISATDLQRRYNHAIAAVSGTDQQMTVTVRGRRSAVLMGVERAEEANRALELVRGLARMAHGKGDPAQLLAQMAASIGQTQEPNDNAA